MKTKSSLNVYRSIIHSSPQMEKPKCPSIDEWINKVKYLYTEILFIN